MRKDKLIVSLLLVSGIFGGCSGMSTPGAKLGAKTEKSQSDKLCLTANDFSGAPYCTEVRKDCPVLVKFLASWCDTCTIEMKSLAKSLAELDADSKPEVLVVGVFENKDSLGQYRESSGMPFPFLLDDGLQSKLALFAIPGTVLLGADGQPIQIKDPESGTQTSVLVGPRDWARPAAKDFLKNICH